MSSDIRDILDLEQLDSNLFRSKYHCENFNNSLFGGQVLSQALMAAYRSHQKEPPHSMHGYFLRAGSAEAPVIYDVENTRDGRSFSTRRVLARQFGRPIFELSASFHKREEGYEHQVAFPDEVPGPEEILQSREGKSLSFEMKAFEKDKSLMPFDFVAAEEATLSKRVISPPINHFWFKANTQLPENHLIHCCTLAFASDLGLLATALMPHDTSLFDKKIMAASIDHAMWFHSRNFRCDEWLLCQTSSPWAGGARGFAQSHIFNQSKQLIASTSQEGLIRPIKVYT